MLHLDQGKLPFPTHDHRPNCIEDLVPKETAKLFPIQASLLPTLHELVTPFLGWCTNSLQLTIP